MTSSVSHNDRIPTDPFFVLLLVLTILWAASRLTIEQADGLAGAGAMAELALTVLRLTHGRR